MPTYGQAKLEARQELGILELMSMFIIIIFIITIPVHTYYDYYIFAHVLFLRSHGPILCLSWISSPMH